MATREIRLGSLTLQPGRQLLGNGGPLPLSRKPLHILSVLAQAGGSLVTKDELMEAVWPGQIVEESALHVHVVALRKALGAEAGRLKTVHGFGYRLELPEGAAAAADGEPVQRSVAVLPFANLTGDPAKDFYGEGLAEELINVLSRVGGLAVSSRTSSFAYHARGTDIREIARQLGVAAVVEGSVREGSDRIRLTVQLIDGATGFHIWSSNFDHDAGDLLDLQDDLARSVAAALGRELGQGTPSTNSAEAMRLYLQARSVATRLSGDALGRSEALHREALALDPDFAAAHAGLAGTLLVAITSGVLPYDRRAEARREAERAVALDPALGGARALLACLEAMQGDWVAAERLFVEALARDEADPLVHEAFAHFVLMPTGMHRRAQHHAERVLALSPARPQSSLLCAMCAMFRGDVRGAGEYLELTSLLGLSEHYPPLRALEAYCLVMQGQAEQAGAKIASTLPQVARDAGGEEIVACVYRVFGGSGDPIASSTALTALFERCRSEEEFWRHSILPSLMFGWQALLGALNRCFETLEAVVERRRSIQHVAVTVVNSLWLPPLLAIRADPRFQMIARDLGLMDYWEKVGPPDGYALTDGRIVPAAPTE